MWLLKLHGALSILLMITFFGFSRVYKETIRQNGWFSEGIKKKYSILLLFFVPIMNVLIVLLLFLMIGMKKEDFEALTNKIKEESEGK